MAPFSDKSPALPTQGAGQLQSSLLVSGATLAGVAAALEARAQGVEVLLVDEGTYPGADWFSTLDCHPLSATRHAIEEELKLPHGALGDDADRALHPRKAKTALEDLLLSAGVQLLYTIRPFAWQMDATGITVDLAGKSGLLRAHVQVVIDATVSGSFAPAFAQSVRRNGHPVRRMAFADVDLAALPSNGAALAISENQFLRWHTGPFDERHVLVEVPVPDSWEGDCETFDQCETASLLRAEKIRRELMSTHPAFSQSRFVGVALLDCGLPPVRFPAGGDFSFSPCEGFYIASAAADLCEDTARRFTQDPIFRIRTGREIADHAALKKRRIDFPNGAGALPEIVIETGVLVVGGGTAGASAAMAAAERGSRVVLAEMHGSTGGTGTLGGISSYWFGKPGGQNLRLTRALKNLEVDDGYAANPEWNIRRWNAGEKSGLLLRLNCEAGVRLLTRALFSSPIMDQNKVMGARFVSPAGMVVVHAGITVDATGDGDLAATAGAPYVYGNRETGSTMWCALVPISSPGRSRSQFTGSVDVRSAQDITRAILSCRRHNPSAWDHSPTLLTRESRHILGEITLTLTDQLKQRHFPDVLVQTFSNHDVKGSSVSDWIRFGLIPPNLEAEIPYRALLPVGIDNLLVTGKAISATSSALPALRMQADFENLGFATGLAAALCHQRSILPRELDVGILQIELVKEGILTDFSLSGQEEKSVSQWIAELDDRVPLQSFQDREMSEVHRDLIPFVEVCTAGPEAIPHLLREVGNPLSPRRVQSAMALAWHRQPEAANVLVEELRRRLDNFPGLPPRMKPVRYAHPPPDQGNLPETACLIHALARCGSPKGLPFVAELIRRCEPSEAALRSTTAGLFDYVEAICRLAQALPSPESIPHLQRLIEHPLWRHKWFTGVYQTDWWEDRKAFLEIKIATALRVCGCADGDFILKMYQTDSRRPLARMAEISRACTQHLQ